MEVVHHHPLARRREQWRLEVSLTSLLAFLALASLILDPLFRSLAALVFLACGMALMGSAPRHSLAAILHSWRLLVLPAYCVVSVIWSQYPLLTLRYSVQLSVTFCIAIVLANRVSPAMLLRFLFGAYGIEILGSLLFGRVRDDIGAWIGIFGSKNAFAAIASGFLLTSIAMLFDRRAGRLTRLIAAAGAVISLPLLVKAQSTGWILFSIPASLVAIGLMASGKMTALQKALIIGVALLAGASLTILLLAHGEEWFADFLALSGKDSTLTGRTDLWAYGLEAIGRNAVLGLGYQAFWVHGNEPAEALWEMFGIASRMGFNFHNMYISNAVEIGLLGLALQVLVLYGAWFKVVRWAWRTPLPENVFLAGYVTMIICASFMEVPAFFQFNVPSIVVVCAYVYGRRAELERDAMRRAAMARGWPARNMA